MSQSFRKAGFFYFRMYTVSMAKKTQNLNQMHFTPLKYYFLIVKQVQFSFLIFSDVFL